MEKYWNFMYFLYIIAILGEKGEGLKCWTCASIFDPECADTFQPKETGDTLFSLAECDYGNGTGIDWSPETFSDNIVCRKVILNLYGTVTVIRGCANGNDENGTTCMQGQPNVQFCETCKENGCNGASRISTVTVLNNKATVSLLFAPLALLLT